MNLIQLKLLELTLEQRKTNSKAQKFLHIITIYNIYICEGSHGRNSCQSGQVRKEAAVTMIAGCEALRFTDYKRDIK